MHILSDIAANLERGDSATLKELIRSALTQKIEADEILNEGLVKSMDALGAKFQKNEVFIPEVLIATRAMKAGLDGGGPVTSPFAYAIKADGYAPDAFSAVDLIKKLMEKKFGK